MTPSQISLHVYLDFDSTVVLQDAGNALLAHEMGYEELKRINRLPETEIGKISLRKAEDMKWTHIRLDVKDAADILVDPEQDVLLEEREQRHEEELRHLQDIQHEMEEMTTTPSPPPLSSTTRMFKRIPFDERNNDASDDGYNSRSYYVQLDPGFKEFHRFCQEHGIPITIVSIGIQPLIEEMLNRYLGRGHGIVVRANGLNRKDDGSWKVLWRDSSPFGVEKGRALREARANDLKKPNTDHILWCGDGSSDFPAALVSDIVLARKNTSLEKLLRANQIPHRAFTTFDTVREAVSDWIREHPKDDFEP
ncbi:hypothetical protein BGZ49_010651 [Haplosporangium sp. Z 27]|nr:hypothetical protein BGZ49_010651 [Haplosporangium sp. Z 27]